MSPDFELTSSQLLADGVTLAPDAELAYREHLSLVIPDLISYFVSRSKRLSGQLIDLVDCNANLSANRTVWVPETPQAPPMESPNSWVLPDSYSTPVIQPSPAVIRPGVYL